MCKSPLYAYRALHVTTFDGEPCYVWDSALKRSVLKRYPVGTAVPVWSSDSAPKLKFLPFDSWTALKESAPENDYFRIACGQCIDCRLKYSKEWATRITCESAMSDCNLFVTLTYDESHLPLSPKGNGLSTLNYNDLQLFLKRLRERCFRDYGHRGIRFYACGEYGSKTARAHYHLCLFNLPREVVLSCKAWSTSFQGDVYYISDYLTRIWGKGYVVCGELNYQSAAYVARYVCKKLRGESKLAELRELGIANQESRMSLKPGIGAEYFHLFRDEIYENDEMFLPSVGKVCVSKYFDRLYDFEDPEFMAVLKAQRAIKAESYLRDKLSQTDLDEVALLRSELTNLEKRVKSLARPL